MKSFLSLISCCCLFLSGTCSATVAFQQTANQKKVSTQDQTTLGKIEVRDPAFLKLIDKDAPIEILARGFKWSEGPVWLAKEKRLLFSDVPNNKIHQWQAGKMVSVFMSPSGYDGKSAEREPGSNGLMLDREGRLLVCDHGNRRIYRVEKDGTKKTLIDRIDGKRFNSPNDLIVHSNGDIYFTDPPYGLADKSKQELDVFGVYRLQPNGKVTVVTDKLTRPNGIALSPDEKTIYVAQSHKPTANYTKYRINGDGTFSAQGMLFDATELAKSDPGMPDGMVVDSQGNLWATGPGGVLVISPKGKLLGRVLTGIPTANCTFGEDGKTLFMTAGKFLLRVKTKAKGLGYK